MEKYDAKYFGVAAGLFSIFLFIMIVVKLIISDGEAAYYVKLFIPFFNGLTVINVLGGIIAAFFWGWVIGFFFILLYSYIDKKLTS